MKNEKRRKKNKKLKMKNKKMKKNMKCEKKIKMNFKENEIMFSSKDQKKSVTKVQRKRYMTMREKCKNRAGLEGKPGLRAWPKCRAPALTRAGPQGLSCDGRTDGRTKKWLIESRVRD